MSAPQPPSPALIRVRHPGLPEQGAPLKYGTYATGGVIHEVDPATAERLLARGFERVTDPTDPTPVLISEE